MNVLFFLIPKNNVEYLYDTYTIRQALEKMENHRYSSIPVINKEGRYIETLSTSDFLWFIKERDLSIFACEKISIKEIKPYRSNVAIRIDKDITELIDLIANQNFVPVEDDNGVFIGIVTRKAIIDFLRSKIKEID
ncbi:MAG: CBS domain-containing protein [Erysipelotrichaceae bacterium]|nr:CBS domain-containing protein [Erysipelotrichaceae bacterium]